MFNTKILKACFITICLVYWNIAYGQVDDKSILETLRIGTKTYLGQVRDGKGNLSHYVMIRKKDQKTQELKILETYAKCSSAFIGQKVRWDIEGTITVNGAPAFQIIEGEKLDTSVVNTKGLFDGEKLTIYDVRRNRADIKNPSPGDRFEWERLLPFFYGTIDIDGLFAEGQNVSVMGQETINNSTCYKIESAITQTANGKEITLKTLVWIDPARGYLVPKKQIWGYLEGKELLLEDFVTELKEYSPGLWGPLRANWVTYRADPPDYQPYKLMDQSVVFENYVFNVNLTDSDLEIKLLDGTEVYDDVLGIRLYIVGKDIVP